MAQHDTDRRMFAGRMTAPLGVGSMFWGDTFLDSLLGNVPTDQELQTILKLARDEGVTVLDTAEGYGGGASEIRIRNLLHKSKCSSESASPLVMTKFIPCAWRWTRASFFKSLDESRRRLGVQKIPVYFIHTPQHPMYLSWVTYACEAQQQGLVEHVGLSNCNAEQVEQAVVIAKQHGVQIVANQILYSLLSYGSASLQEVEQVCQSHGIAIIAYAVLGQGLLTDGLTKERFQSIRAARMTGVQYEELSKLRSVIADIAQSHQVTMAQVCLRWAIDKQAIPLVGARSSKQFADALKALKFRLTPAELLQLDQAALKRATLEKSRIRRTLFVLLISVLIFCYYATRFIKYRYRRKQ